MDIHADEREGISPGVGAPSNTLPLGYADEVACCSTECRRQIAKTTLERSGDDDPSGLGRSHRWPQMQLRTQVLRAGNEL